MDTATDTGDHAAKDRQVTELVMRARRLPQDRPWSARVWFTRPQWHWFGWHTLVPVLFAGDEYDWHCAMLGWTITGRVTIALWPCPMRNGLWWKCADTDDLPTKWPISNYFLDELTPSYAAEIRRIFNETD